MSGSGTNIGIEYQQKVSAWFTLQMFLRTNISNFIRGLNSDFIINEIGFETDSEIDDLNLKCNNGTLFIQIKHSLSLSESDESCFNSVLDQFINRYIKGTNDDKYLLIVSSKSSRKITVEFSKILDSIRLNELSFQTNPLTISENDVLIKYTNIFDKYVKKYNLSKDTVFIDFSKKIHVITFDIEKGQPFEIATLMQIAQYSDISAELVWSNLIIKTLEYSSKRLSLSMDASKGILGNLLIKNITDDEILTNLPDWFIIHKNPDGLKFSSGVEYIFGEGLGEGFAGRYFILELFRFDEFGRERLQFSGSFLHLDNGLEFKLIYRCSTITRLELLVSQWLNKNKDKEIIIVKGNFDKDEENSSVFAMAHSEMLEKTVPNRLKDLYCIHCTDYISERDVIIVEYSNNGIPKVGCVHEKCRLGQDRIIGHIPIDIYEKHPYLNNFNYEKWITAWLNSHNSLYETRKIKTNSAIIAWDDKFQVPSGDYCFSFTLFDGSKQYVHKRSLIDRSKNSDKDKFLAELNELVNNARKKNDPLCYTSKNRQFGNYSFLLVNKDDDEEILEINTVSCEKYSLSLKNSYEKVENYYTPVFYLEHDNKESILTFGQYVVLLTDPLNFVKYKNNWERYGIDIGNHKMVIIENDNEFDLKVRRIFDDGLIPIVDPLIGSNNSIIQGKVIKKLSNLG